MPVDGDNSIYDLIFAAVWGRGRLLSKPISKNAGRSAGVIGRDRSAAHHAGYQILRQSQPCGAMRYASIAPYLGLRVTAFSFSLSIAKKNGKFYRRQYVNRT